ncbi:hypothetical protein [Priestia megaterium]|uniref:hypothetical protein n=1 Tax=Priestia megaterium TaxID=1404 RepID=UPI002E1D3C93|nr:hypothetical protein [Priestia megaterium]
MRIIPLSELRDTKHISDIITEEKEPIFVTKQGAQHLVVLPHDLYVEMERKIKALNQ